MRPQETESRRSTHQPLGDPEFRLDPSYRRRLTSLAESQYQAARRGDRSRVDRLRSRLVDDSPIGAGVGRVVYPLPERAYDDGRYDGYVLKLPLPEYHDRYGYEVTEPGGTTPLGAVPHLVARPGRRRRAMWPVARHAQRPTRRVRR